MKLINNDWDDLLKDEFKKDYYLKLREFLKIEYSTKVIYPNMYDIFNALRHTSYADTKIVLLGQDPYHGPNQAHGMAFSVKPEVRIPPSLLNIFKELRDDLGCSMPTTGYLTTWADQGVLLLNTVLTVVEGKPNSHKNMGWEIFTDRIIELINQKGEPVIFLLWGNNAKEKIKLVTNSIHYILTAPHPSPMARGFNGCKHFSKANGILVSLDKEPINWQIS